MMGEQAINHFTLLKVWATFFTTFDQDSVVWQIHDWSGSELMILPFIPQGLADRFEEYPKLKELIRLKVSSPQSWGSDFVNYFCLWFIMLTHIPLQDEIILLL